MYLTASLSTCSWFQVSSCSCTFIGVYQSIHDLFWALWGQKIKYILSKDAVSKNAFYILLFFLLYIDSITNFASESRIAGRAFDSTSATKTLVWLQRKQVSELITYLGRLSLCYSMMWLSFFLFEKMWLPCFLL